jgi:hypothetical protein
MACVRGNSCCDFRVYDTYTELGWAKLSYVRRRSYAVPGAPPPGASSVCTDLIRTLAPLRTPRAPRLSMALMVR